MKAYFCRSYFDMILIISKFLFDSAKYVASSLCPSNITTSCLEYMTSQTTYPSQNLSAASNVIQLTLTSGLNNITLAQPFTVPAGAFLFLQYPFQGTSGYHILIDTNQSISNADFYFNCPTSSKTCTQQPLDSNLTSKINIDIQYGEYTLGSNLKNKICFILKRVDY